MVFIIKLLLLHLVKEKGEGMLEGKNLFGKHFETTILYSVFFLLFLLYSLACC